MKNIIIFDECGIHINDDEMLSLECEIPSMNISSQESICDGDSWWSFLEKLNPFLADNLWEDVLRNVEKCATPRGEFFSFEEVEHIVALAINNIDLDHDIICHNDRHEQIGKFSLKDIFTLFVFNNKLDAEQGEIETCKIWSMQLQKFIDLSSWHVGIENEIWYGSNDPTLYPSWKYDGAKLNAFVTIENGMGSYGGQHQYRGYEINYNNLFNGNGSWYFGAYGESGAEFDKVIDDCPIPFDILFSNKVKEDILSLIRDHN